METSVFTNYYLKPPNHLKSLENNTAKYARMCDFFTESKLSDMEVPFVGSFWSKVGT